VILYCDWHVVVTYIKGGWIGIQFCDWHVVVTYIKGSWIGIQYWCKFGSDDLMSY
jgi:hypothetical protein